MFTAYVAAWLPDMLVESSTGIRTSVNVLFEVTQTSAVQLLTTRELPLRCFKATQYTAYKINEAQFQQQYFLLVGTDIDFAVTN